jgi:hypothetical protein
MLMKHEEDPKDALLNSIGDVSSVELFGKQVLLAVYQRPEKTRSGILLTANTRAEDQYQGKAALIVAKGPLAFDEGYQKAFGSGGAAVGDWIVIRPSDGWPVTVNGVLCRIIEDEWAKMKIDHPDRVW